jgi:hypothetical protein
MAIRGLLMVLLLCSWFEGMSFLVKMLKPEADLRFGIISDVRGEGQI